MPEPSPPFELRRLPGFFVVELSEPTCCLSWAPHGGGVSETSRVVWHGVTPECLPEGRDPLEVLHMRLRASDLLPCVAMMTSRDLAHVHLGHARTGGVGARAIVTAGYSNAVRVGDPVAGGSAGSLVEVAALPSPGTINVLLHVDVPLTLSAQLEVMSLVVEARTLAVIEHPVRSVQSDALATGTGTDCVTILSPTSAASGAEPRCYAGKHTTVGSSVGAASLRALREATQAWHAQRAKRRSAGALEDG